MRFEKSDTVPIEVGQVAFLDQESDQASGENSVKTSSWFPPLAVESCIELLHDLNHTFAAVLLNAQVLDGKLPSYSRSKRYIHEIERGAQRGTALLKRLLDRLAADGHDTNPNEEFEPVEAPPVGERVAVLNQGPPEAEKVIGLAPFPAANAAPAFSAEMADAHRKV